MHILGNPCSFHLFPKARYLNFLRQEGLFVPQGLVLEEHEFALQSIQIRQQITALLANGPVIVRALLPFEDTATQAAPGLGESIPDCTSFAHLHEAIRKIKQIREYPWLANYHPQQSGHNLPLQVLIHQQIPRKWLIVTAQTSTSIPYIEVYQDALTSLQGQHTPHFSGPLPEWDQPHLICKVQEFCTQINLRIFAEIGLDCEMVVDPQDQLWIVQVRPLTRELNPGFHEFLALVQSQENPTIPNGYLRLDGEHNPEPLSPAHAWLVSWVHKNCSQTPSYHVLAGWLYARQNTRQSHHESMQIDPLEQRNIFRQLHEVYIPSARAWLEDFKQRLATSHRQQIVDDIFLALHHFLEITALYQQIANFCRKPHLHQAVHLTHASVSLSLLAKEHFLDVLPSSWDIASPELHRWMHDNQTQSAQPCHEVIAKLSDEEINVLICEWDDHLFALGLAAIRYAYLKASELLSVDDRQIFLWTPDELRKIINENNTDLLARLAEREQQQEKYAALQPPQVLYDGQPLPAPSCSYLRGIPIGPSITGYLAIRKNLQDLLEHPIPSAHHSILAIPALTAQAAVVLHALGIHALCCEFGSAMSHAALMARELNLSALIACRGCTSLPDHSFVQLDTRTGFLRLLSPT